MRWSTEPAAVEAGEPPDFLFGTFIINYIAKWALDDRLVDLTDPVGHFSDLFDPDALAWWVLLNEKTGHRAGRPAAARRALWLNGGRGGNRFRAAWP
jgi:hypothetical protein